MKNIKIFSIIALLSTALLWGCYDDQGNYDYREINDIIIDTAGFQTTYNTSQFRTLKIDPVVRFSQEPIDASRLDYKWTIYNPQDDKISQVIGTEKVLDYTVIQESNDTRAYVLLLEVTDKQTGIASQMRFTVWITSEIATGWLVLHGNATECDLDYVATPNTAPALTENKVIHNLFSLSNGHKIPGEPRFVRGARRNMISSGVTTVHNSIYVGTSSGFYKLAGKNFATEYTMSQMFPAMPAKVNPQAVDLAFGASNPCVTLINDGKAHHHLVAQSFWEISFTYALAPNTTAIGAQELDLAPFVYTPEETATTTGMFTALYDNTRKAFVIDPNSSAPAANISRFPDQDSGQDFDVNNIGKQMLYMGKGYTNYCYAIFKDLTGEGRWLYIANFTKKADGKMAVSKHDMTALPEIAQAKFYSTGNRGNVLLYATGQNVYTYDYSPANAATKILSFPAGEQITSMKIYKPGTNSSLNYNYPQIAVVNCTVLYVATWNGSEGKLYEYSLNETSGTLRNTTPLNTFTGFGRIYDMNHKLQ